MARAFAAGNQHLSHAAAVISAYPFTIAAWANTTTSAAAGTVWSISDGTTDNAWEVRFSTTPDVNFRSVVAGTAVSAAAAIAYTVNTWHHVVAVGAGATDRTIYLDGGNSGTNATSSTPSGVNITKIGIQGDGTTRDWQGRIADVAIWNIALTAADAAMLAKGASPLSVRPDALVAYWPLIGRDDPEPDFVGGFNMTLQNTPTQGDHPRLNRLWKRLFGITTAGAAAPPDDTPISVSVGVTVRGATALGVGKISIVSGLVASSVRNVVGLGASVAVRGTAAIGSLAIAKAIAATVTGTVTTVLSITKAIAATVVVTPVQSLLLTLQKFIGYGGIALSGPGRWRDRKPGWVARDAKWTKRR